MPKFEKIKIPEGDLIKIENGKLVVGDRPIIGYLRGDGIGLDITPAMQKVVAAAVDKAYSKTKQIQWCPIYAGLEALLNYKTDNVLPDEAIEAISYLKVAIKGPFTTPIGEETHVCLYCAHQQNGPGTCEKCKKTDGVASRFRSINVGLRQKLDLYACVRPVKYFDGVPCPNKSADKVNFVIFRENTEDVYAGHDFERGSDVAVAIIDLVEKMTGKKIRPDSGIGIKPISETGTKRLVAKACEWAIEQKLPSVTLVHKGNIMKFTEGSFAKWGYEVANEKFPGAFITEKDLWEKHNGNNPEGKIIIKDRIADSIFQQIQTRPEEYSVMALPNLNGDYLSDAAIALVGGLGLGPGANIGQEVAIFEATHGTAPKYTGMDKVNPGSIILSAVMMLNHMGWNEAADLILQGIQNAITQGTVTYDLARLMKKEGRTDVTKVSCSGFAEAIISNM